MKSLGHFLPRITNKTYQKFGFSREEVLNNWEEIIGREFAQVCQPEKIIWSHRKPVSAKKEVTISKEDSFLRRGATLKIRVEPHAALEIESQTRYILERINRYFGYRAVTRMTIIQGPVATNDSKTEKQPPSNKTKTSSINQFAKPDGFHDAGLAAALQKLKYGLNNKA